MMAVATAARTGQREAARTVADVIADGLASPSDVQRMRLMHRWRPHCLAYGAVGIALLHVEVACAERAPWQRVHDWLTHLARTDIPTGNVSHLYHGAPAVGFVLHAAAEHAPGGSGRYARAVEVLDHHIATATRHRLVAAHARIDRGELPTLAEFDAIRGLTGIGAHLLRHWVYGDQDADLLRALLAYLVRLTEPLEHAGDVLPGWWSSLAPTGRPSPHFPDGHANNGMAHGISGPLALLSLAARRHITVDGQLDAIRRICGWLDNWQQDGPAGLWWPYWVTRAQLRTGRVDNAGPFRASWCYGTAGLARTQQLAALATGDTARQQLAEGALAQALTDPSQLATITDSSLCHGYAGLAHIATRAAADAINPALAACVPPLVDRILASLRPDTESGALNASLALCRDGDVGLLEGAAGIALALHTTGSTTPSICGWDSCLLIN